MVRVELFNIGIGVETSSWGSYR